MTRLDTIAPVIRAVGADDRSENPDRLAAKLLDILRECSRDEQLAVLLACAERFPSAIHDDRHQRAIAALRISAEFAPKVTVASYDRWRRSQDDPSAQPSPQQIVRLFDGWASALTSAGLRGAGDPRATRAVSTGRRFTEAQVVDLMRQFADGQPGLLIERDFLDWCRDRSGRWQPGDPLHPHSASVLQRLGGWHHLLEKAGLIERGSLASYVRQKPWRYSRATMVMWVRRIAQAVEGPLTMTAYEAERARRRVSAQASGRDLSIPYSQALRNRFGSWLDVLEAAGLRHRASVTEATSTAAYRPSELIEAVQAAARASGLPLARPAYDRWRVAEMERTGERVPHSSLIAKKVGCGSWATALRVVVDDMPIPVGEPDPDRRRSATTRSECLHAVKAALADCGAPLSRDRFTAWQADERENGRARPHYRTIARNLGGGSWVAAIVIATEASAAHLPGGHQAPGTRYPKSESKAMLCRAIADLGADIRVHEYVEWREQLLRRLREQDPLARVPSASVIKRDLGSQSWTRAVAAARGDDDRTEDPA